MSASADCATHQQPAHAPGNDQALLPTELFKYAVRFAKRAERAGRGTQHPTFRQAAKRFRVSLDAIEDACNDYNGAGYMRPAVAYAVGGSVGMHGAAAIEQRSDWLVEAYDDYAPPRMA